MVGKLLKVFVACTMVFSLILVKKSQVDAAETNLEVKHVYLLNPVIFMKMQIYCLN